jgi:hypothetical protein
MRRNAMRSSMTILFSLLIMMSFVSTASALVTVDATTTVDSPLRVGDSFDVDILVSWDGAGELIGIFSSHVWDKTQLEIQGAVFPLSPLFETRPLLLRGGSYDPVLSRFGTIAGGIFGDDLASSARTVQYGTIGNLNPATSADMNQLVTRLTFRVIGGIDEGPVEVVGALLIADTGALGGDSFKFGSEVSVTVVPEPGVALLLGLGLAGLASSHRHERRTSR